MYPNLLEIVTYKEYLPSLQKIFTYNEYLPQPPENSYL
jgi:hypothetical protein